MTEQDESEDEFAPVTPGKMLKDEFVAEYRLSQSRLARAVGISPNRICDSAWKIDPCRGVIGVQL